MLFGGFGLIFIALTKKCQHVKLINYVRSKFVSFLLWNPVISFCNESYLIYAISSLINFKTRSLRNPGEYCSYIFACFGVLLIVIYPIFVLVFLQIKFKRLASEEHKKKYGELYEYLRFKESKHKLYEPVYTLLRRLVLAVTMIYSINYKTF